MSQGKSTPQKVTATATIAPDEEKVEDQIHARRADFAFSFTKVIAIAITAACIPMMGLGLYFQDFPQLLMASVFMIPFGVSTWVYPVLYRKGRMKLGIWSCLVLFLVMLIANLVLLPDVVLPAMVGLAILIVIGSMLLGAKERLSFGLVVALALAGYVAFGKDITQNQLLPLDPAITKTIEVSLGLIAVLVLTLIVHKTMADQETFLVELKSANLQIEKRVAIEKEQRERLQAVAKEYVEYMARVGQGNLATRLTFGDNGHGDNDPLIVLGHNLNQMVANLQGMILQIRDASTNLSSSTTEILAATTQQASGANEQSAAITQTTTTVDQVKVIAEQLVERGQEVVDISQRTVKVSLAGKNTVQETIGGMNRIRERVESIAKNIIALSEQTLRIREIIATVDDIAAQSNMLALNASVEAAHAGEHGKGFAAVAVEVRNLARQSQQATTQVRAILSQVQKGISDAATTTEGSTKVVEEGMQLAVQTQETIGQLAAVIDESAQMAMQMVAGGRQQASGVEQIAVAMQNINQATAQNLSSTRQTEDAAQNLNSLARSLTETVEQYQL